MSSLSSVVPNGPVPGPAMAWPDLDVHAHSVQFYADDTFLLGALGRFVGAALGAGDTAVVLATPAHREAVAERLTERGLDIARAARQGRYVALDAAELLAQCSPRGWPDADRFADLIGGIVTRASAAARSERPRVAIFGELVALSCADGQPEAAIRLEELWNDMAQAHPFNLRCGYPLHVFGHEADAAAVRRICAAHTHVIPAEDYTALPEEPDRLRAVALLQQKAGALLTEVAERKKAEQALQRTNQELGAALAARDEFLSVAAHELKTPLTSLRAFAQLLLRDTRRGRTIAPEQLASALEAIEGETGKLDHLIQRLLDTEQIDAGKLRLELAPTDLIALVYAALARQGEDTTNRFVVDGPAHLDVLVDPVRFEHVIANLLDNAVKFSLTGGTIGVEIGRDDAGGVRLCVTDRGVGIPSDQRGAVFGRFYQAHGQRHLSGLGLGLYVAREIVELHGGTVRIEEPKHPGTRVVVTLPPATAAPRPPG